MAHNTKPVLKDVENKPVPQYYNPKLDTFEVLEGENGASKNILYDSYGNEVDIVGLLTPIVTKLEALAGTIIDEETRKQNESTRIQAEQSRVTEFSGYENRVSTVETEVLELQNDYTAIKPKLIDARDSAILATESANTATSSANQAAANANEKANAVDTATANAVIATSNANAAATNASTKADEIQSRFNDLLIGQQQDAEVIDARKGKTTLREKIDEIDSKFKGLVAETGWAVLRDKYYVDPFILGAIVDMKGNPIIKADGYHEDAANEVTIANAIAGKAPEVKATGKDRDIDLNLVPKGTGVIRAKGKEVATQEYVQDAMNSIDVSTQVATGINDHNTGQFSHQDIRQELENHESQLNQMATDLITHKNENTKKHIHSSGTNSNGSYIKFDDGTLICFGSITLSDVVANSNGDGTWTFPSLFNTPPTINITLGGISGHNNFTVNFLRSTSASTTVANVRLSLGTSSASQSYTLLLIGIGRWKA